MGRRAAMCQQVLPQVSAADVEPQIRDGMHALRRALNSGRARVRGSPALGPPPSL